MNQSNREQKRAQFSASTSAKRNRAIPLLIAGLIGVAGYFVATNFRGQAAPAAATAAAPAPNRDIVIPLPEVSSGKAKFFDYAASGRKTVRFFAIKSSDGAYRVALDACDVCYHAKKGYEQSGDDMVCRNCRRRFPSTLIGEANGGCNPIAVARTIAGDKIIIKAADLDGMTAYF